MSRRAVTARLTGLEASPFSDSLRFADEFRYEPGMIASRQIVPLVAVAADYKEIDGYRWHAAAETYLKAVIVGIGGIPLIVPALGEALDLGALLDRIDG